LKRVGLNDLVAAAALAGVTSTLVSFVTVIDRLRTSWNPHSNLWRVRGLFLPSFAIPGRIRLVDPSPTFNGPPGKSKGNEICHKPQTQSGM
jgi:hypothetical protein